MDISMVDTNVLVAQLGFVEAIGCAIVAGVFGMLMKRQDRKQKAEREADLKYREEREREEAAEKAERKAKEMAKKEFDKAKLDLLFATATGLDVALQALHGDEVNGNVEEARRSISKAKSECNRLTNGNAVEYFS